MKPKDSGKCSQGEEGQHAQILCIIKRPFLQRLCRPDSRKLMKSALPTAEPEFQWVPKKFRHGSSSLPSVFASRNPFIIWKSLPVWELGWLPKDDDHSKWLGIKTSGIWTPLSKSCGMGLCKTQDGTHRTHDPIVRSRKRVQNFRIIQEFECTTDLTFKIQGVKILCYWPCLATGTFYPVLYCLCVQGFNKCRTSTYVLFPRLNTKLLIQCDFLLKLVMKTMKPFNPCQC